MLYRLSCLPILAALIAAPIARAAPLVDAAAQRVIEADASGDRVDLDALARAIENLVIRFPYRYPGGQRYLERLAEYQGGSANRPEWVQSFRALQREALIANPLVSAQPILFVVRSQYKSDHHNTATLFQRGEINAASFEGAGALKAIDFARDGQAETLLSAPEGIIRDPEVHFSGARIVFSMRKNADDDYHIYEINADGTGLIPRTVADHVSDIDPLYLPGGDMVFSSTREPKYCMCNRHIMANLYRMGGDGANIHQIGKSTLFEGQGTLMPDGKILYYRWEYVDRNFGDAQGLWTVNPDGTNHAVYWGNNTNSPGGVIDARPIPGTQRVLCTFGSCHDRPWGAVAMVDRRLGLDGKDAVIRTWPADAIDLVEVGDFDTFKRVTPKYEDPYPLDDTYFLCARMTGQGEQMGIYLLDTFGNEIQLHAEGAGCLDPMPLCARACPPVIPERRDYNNQDGYFYVADVYEGTHMAGVERGSIKSLRVVESPEKRYWTAPRWNGQGTAAPAMNWHDFNNKCILGTVPVHEDGSVYFAVPSDTFVYFQLLDDVDLGAANPWGVVCTTNGKWLCVAHCGTHELSVIDRDLLHTKLADAVTAGEAESVPNDLAFLVGLRKLVSLPGKGPRGVAVLGSRVFAAGYFSGSLASVELPLGDRPKVQSFTLGTEPAISAIRAGETFFHDGSAYFQQWQSCASCHPGDGRVDALNWDLLNDGMGNPKNSKSLLLCYDTPPGAVIAIPRRCLRT